MNSNALLDALKNHTGVPSDYALARDVLKVDPNSLRDMRERGLSDARALQIATMLGIEPGPVLADVQAERARDPAVRKAWEKVAKTIRSAAAAVLCVVGIGISSPEPAGAAQSVYPGIHYANQYLLLTC